MDSPSKSKDKILDAGVAVARCGVGVRGGGVGCWFLDWFVGCLDNTDHCWLRYENESNECMGWCRPVVKIAEETAAVVEENSFEADSRDLDSGLAGIE